MLSCVQPLAAQSFFHVSPDTTEYSLNGALEILEDKQGNITLEDIRSERYNQAFTRYTGKNDPNFGHTRVVYWVRIRLVLPQEAAQHDKMHDDWFLEINYPQLDNIRFFAPNLDSLTPENLTNTRLADLPYAEKQSGDMFPFAMRDLSYRMPTFRLPMQKLSTSEKASVNTDSVLTVYFRLESQGSMTFPIMLRSGAAMSRHIVNEQFLLGMFYGILAIMLGYNLFVYFSLRDISYLYYVAYIATYGLFLFIWNGLAFQYLWSESPLWHNRSIIVFMGLSGLSVFAFSQNYLDTRHLAPRAHKFMNVVMGYFIVGMALAFVLPYMTAIRIMYGAPIITLPIIVTVSVIAIRKNYRPARYFLFAWILLLTSIASAALRNINLLPSGPLTIYGLQIGSALEIFLLSLGLADRINIMREEKRVAEAETLRSTELLIETLKQSEQELERKVRERTAELEEANEEISRQLEVQAEQSREIELANTALQEKNLLIEQERERSELLLLNVLPSSIAARLMGGEKLIADRFESVTVLFADISGFTTLSSSIPPEELVGLLDTVFTEFDAISERFGLEKIKTIGDCFMAVSGLPTPQNDHAERAANAAIAMMQELERLNGMLDMNLSMRIGLHTGAVVAGVIGQKKFAYDLWGDTVNTASRMEAQGVAGKIHVSEAVYRALVPHSAHYRFEARGMVEVKGKGQMQTWFLAGI
ncbi:MAG: hypothetical protein MUF71_09590 [Candidatus Kapabacteria bacterium]|nr:hypothetical protein [Candidatus Kapabacteria bacterium]